MEHIAAIMVLIGCGHGDTECMEFPAPQIGYETVQACEREIDDALRSASKNRPIVYGQCEEIDPALFETDAVVAWNFDETGALEIDVAPASTLYAETDMVTAAQ